MTDPIEFEVRYRLGEYRLFVHDMLARRLPELSALTGKRADGLTHRLTLASLVVVLPVVFLYKVTRVGRCHFTIDDAGIRRRCRAGESFLAWADVKGVHGCRPGLLVQGPVGGFPLPDRAMGSAQRGHLRALVEGRGFVVD